MSFRATLLTVHGFWSSPKTWDRLASVWSADESLRGLTIHPFGYLSPKKPRVPFSASRIPDYNDIAQTLATEYMTKLADNRPIAIVAHSQGGLIVQRFMTWMLQQGNGRDLARIASVTLLCCPNNGSDYLGTIRAATGFRRHAQAGSLELLDKQVADTQRIVLQRIVNAQKLDDSQCPIPYHVYAGASDKVVVAASAQAAFPGASTLPGDHFSVLDPTSVGNCTAATVRHHLLNDVDRWGAAEAGAEVQTEVEAEAQVPHLPADHERATRTRSGLVVEGPAAAAGNVTLSGKYVAGHDMNFGKEN